ncbi:hypothetical protein [Zhouia amylolytica]|uniref:Uncharacterized protein n=1 Tax=Zhouia amylolytica AD3 TaxID=1286632 RepID=W2UKF2_9FLAO|nr:hypothetical protein [Zhouia amylolytica]ETN94479.1 hypothetical protein P278_24220 [Zhouia amylolytica AD3]
MNQILQKINKRNKKLMFLVLGVLLVVAMSSYNLSPSSTKKKPIDYIAYMRTINKAESYILKEQYDSALVMYKRAFKNIDKPLAGHSFTAMQTSAYLDKEKDFKNLTNQTFKCGLEIEDITSDSLLSDYIRTHKLNDFLHSSYKKNNPVYKNRINISLKDSIIKLAQWDSKWKRYYTDSLSKVHPEKEELYKYQYDTIVSEIVEDYLIPIIEKYGYPGERMIGHGRTGITGRSSYRSITVRNLLMHYYGIPKTQKQCRYNSLFLNEVYKGNMSPRDYATIIDFQIRKRADTICSNLKLFNEHHIVTDTTKYKEYNIRRETIGLEPMEEKIAKYKRGQEICRKIRKEKKYKHVKLFYWCG